MTISEIVSLSLRSVFCCDSDSKELRELRGDVKGEASLGSEAIDGIAGEEMDRSIDLSTTCDDCGDLIIGFTIISLKMD